MLTGLRETVTVTVPSGGQVDTLTGERISGGASTTYSVSVVWLGAPKREIQIDRKAGTVLGYVKTGDAQLLYEPTGQDTDVDWGPFARPDVVVDRAGDKYQVVRIDVSPLDHSQLVTLMRREGGQSAGA